MSEEQTTEQQEEQQEEQQDQATTPNREEAGQALYEELMGVPAADATAQEEAPEEKVKEEKEEAPEESHGEEKKPDRLSAVYRDFERKERALRAKAQELKRMEEELSGLRELKAKQEEDPYSVIESLGLSQEELVDLALSGKLPEKKENKKTDDASKEEIASLRSELENLKLDRIKREHVSGVQNFVKSSAEKFPLVAELAEEGSVEAIINFQARWHQETGEIPSAEEAAKYIEEYYEEQVKGVVERAKKLEKFREYFGDTVAPQQKQVIQSERSKTLTNKQQSEAPLSRSPDEMTDEERMKLAVEQLEKEGFSF